MRLLLLSSSHCGEGCFLQHAVSDIEGHFDAVKEVLFVPFAAVTQSFDDYTAQVAAVLSTMGINTRGIHGVSDAEAAVATAQGIAVGGGNTFALLSRLQRSGLMPLLRKRLLSGVPYLGWSAGSNIAGPTICTTNDMPIVETAGLEALGLLPFQINPHFTDALPAGHRGETRSERLREYLALNPERSILALPETAHVKVDASTARVRGPEGALWFNAGYATQQLDDGYTLDLT